jgi:uncharacterized paraquat-inducible protein A
MLNQSVPFLTAYLSYAAVATAMTRASIFALLFRLGANLRVQLATRASLALAQAVQLVIWLIPIVFGYLAYSDIAAALLGPALWLYQLLFIMAASSIVAALAWLVFQNLDALTDLALPQIRRLHTAIAARPAGTSPRAGDGECPQCHQTIGVGQRFCRSCGAALQTT